MSTALRGLVLDEASLVTRSELCGSGRITAEELDILDALGLVLRTEPDAYPASTWHRVNRALRLRRGLEVEWEIVALIMDLLQEIDTLKAQARHLEAMQGYQDRPPRDESEGA